ncbi:MAG: hypothetical protein QOJ54_681 [Aliidongia sp.]|nr:hypothetical protein [Aliidongia sp.]
MTDRMTKPTPKVAPFDPAHLGDDEPQFDINPFTPQRAEAGEPPPATGLDLTGKPKIIFAAGRGKTGKTTLLRWIAELALSDERSFLMADIDPTNASFASYFQNVSRPGTDDPVGVARWLQQFIEYAIRHRTSALVDLGGGDTTLRTIATEMPGFADQIEAAGVSPVVFYLAGTQPDDLAPIATLADRAFHPAARAIVLNESAAELGLTRQQAFAHIVRNRVFLQEMTGGTICLWMPRLHAASAVELRRSSFSAARDGLTEPPLGLFDRARVKVWLDAMARQFQGVRSWMP